jgi:hypothetical protein
MLVSLLLDSSQVPSIGKLGLNFKDFEEIIERGRDFPS